MASLPSPREPFLDQRLHAVLTQRGKELLGLGLIGLGLVLALILGSYAPQDPGWMAATGEPVRNALGRPGAAVAAPLVIITGMAGWGLALALAVWGLRLMIHRGEGAILARSVFVPVAVALTTVWLASLVPGAGWRQDFGLGGMFGDTVLGALLSALPISTGFGFNLLTVVLFVATAALWLYVLGSSVPELTRIGLFLLAGLVLAYAGLLAALGGVMRGTMRAGAGLSAGVAGGAAALRAQRRAPAAPPPVPPLAPRARVPLAEPAMATGWADPATAAAAQRVARVVRAEAPAHGAARAPDPARSPSAPRAPIAGHSDPYHPDPYHPDPYHADPYRPDPSHAAGHTPCWPQPDPYHAQSGRETYGRPVAPHAGLHPPVRATAPAPEPPLRAPLRAEPVPGWGQPAATSLLSRVSALGRRLSDPMPAQSQDHEPELFEPPLAEAAARAAPPPPERIRDRISDLLRNRKRAKPVLRFDPAVSPPAPGLRPEPALTAGPAPVARGSSGPAPAPVAAPVAAAAVAAPQGPASAGGFGFPSFFGLSHSFGWSAPAPVATAAPVAAAEPFVPHEDEPEATDPALYGEPPAASRAAGVYNRRVIQPAARKPVAPSARARAEAQPSLPFEPARPVYELPPLALLADPGKVERYTLSDDALEENARMLESVLDDYGVRGEIVAVRPGPVVTLYELEPAPGLKASRVIGLADDIARSMSALSARVSTVPGRSVIGIELPNARREKVILREILGSRDFDNDALRLPLALGKDIGGEAVVANLAKMPHLLIAGTTGSGKSVAINTMILSLLYKLTPADCRLIMIDPKMLELSVYDGIPHLLSPVVTDPKKAVTALKWVVGEMEERYRRMSRMGVRNIEGYNGRVREALARGEMFSRTIQTGFDDETGDPVFETEEFAPEVLPFIVVIVDEMADLMMVAGKEIEACIQRLAQMARASGIHLIMATQRPSVDVITGTIKANFPTRISFQVTSKIDSRTILGEQGAEQLLGMGDMLYMAGGSKITRIHGPFVSDEEVEEVVNHLKSFGPPAYETGVLDGPEGERETEIDAVLGLGDASGDDALYDQAVAIVARDRKCSTSYIQRKLGIGYNKAARLVEQMETEGVVSRANQVGKREILVPEMTDR